MSRLSSSKICRNLLPKYVTSRLWRTVLQSIKRLPMGTMTASLTNWTINKHLVCGSKTEWSVRIIVSLMITNVVGPASDSKYLQRQRNETNSDENLTDSKTERTVEEGEIVEGMAVEVEEGEIIEDERRG